VETNKKVERSVLINASASKVWTCLTDPNLMKEWKGEPGMHLEIYTNWIVGTPISIKGFHHVHFENKGTVIQFDPQKIIQYSHLSSISHLPETKENYTIITFIVSPDEEKTLLKIRIENFPSASIYQHLNFYWTGTMKILKDFAEQQEVEMPHNRPY
jgi:uncharacterized protein YndB with AHSA1/START domain